MQNTSGKCIFIFHYPVWNLRPLYTEKLLWHFVCWLWMLISCLWKNFGFKNKKKMLTVTNEWSLTGIRDPCYTWSKAAQCPVCVLWSLHLRFHAEACSNLDKALEMISAALIQTSLIETFGCRANTNQILWYVSIIAISSHEKKVPHAIISCYVLFASLIS